MGIKVKFKPGDVETRGRGIYRRVDSYLVYERSDLENSTVAGSQDRETVASCIPSRRRRFLLIADTLTITFGEEDLHLLGLDAYTNSDFWAECGDHVHVPRVKAIGSLYIDGAPADEDRATLETQPQYAIGPDRTWVRVILQEGEAEHYQVGEGLVVGLIQHKIADIFLINVQL